MANSTPRFGIKGSLLILKVEILAPAHEAEERKGVPESVYFIERGDVLPPSQDDLSEFAIEGRAPR
jgi:hypothetical protein